jgi:hypothetical protein
MPTEERFCEKRHYIFDAPVKFMGAEGGVATCGR